MARIARIASFPHLILANGPTEGSKPSSQMKAMQPTKKPRDKAQKNQYGVPDFLQYLVPSGFIAFVVSRYAEFPTEVVANLSSDQTFTGWTA